MEDNDVDDDSVIFKNSPLEQYLTEIGCESESILREKATNLSIADDQKPPRNLFNKLTSFIEIPSFVNVTSEAMDTEHAITLFETVLSSNLLEDDDRQILENLFYNRNHEIVQNRNKLKTKVSNEFWLNSIAVLLLACLIGVLTHNPQTYGIVLIELLVTLVLSYCSFCLWRRRLRKRFWYNRISDINWFINIENCLNSELKKILQNIRDREILNLGYTLVTKFTTISSRFSAPPFSHGIPLANVRETLLNCVLDLFRNFRMYTNHLSTRNCSKMLNDDFILAKLDEKLFLGFLDSSDERLTLTALKTCCQYFSLQRSEFLRFWILSVCYFLFLENDVRREKSYYKTDDNYSLSDLTNKTKLTLERLLTATKIYSPQELLESNSDCRLILSDANNDSSVAFKSLKLHLQVALEKIINLSDKVERENNNKFDESLINLLPLIELDVKASLNCINEIRENFEKKNIKREIEPFRTQSVKKETETKIINEEYEPLIEDQVFEGFPCRNDEKCDKISDIDEIFESGKSTISRHNLLDELKSVLHVRSTSMHEREMRALASHRGIPLEDLIKEEENQSSSAQDERRFKYEDDDKLPSSNWTTERLLRFSQRTSDDDANDVERANPFNVNLADELKRALLARSGFTGRNFEEQIGDDDDDDNLPKD